MKYRILYFDNNALGREGKTIVSLDTKSALEAIDEHSVILETLIDGGLKRIIINIKELEVIDSTGISWLINIGRYINKNDGELVICGASPDIMNTFKIVRFDSVTRSFNNIEDALAYLQDKENVRP